MSQFYAYHNPNPASCSQYPYLLDIQSDLLSELRTRVVIPLTPAKLGTAIGLTRLNPSLLIDGQPFTLLTQQMAGIDRKQLGAKAGDLSAYRTEIMAALDFVVSGI
ncbi:CcdB family protein [Rheinheimera sp.]|uniref:CcdB family protein n=1 Tax=Rheinheimera sp. TaxID=1869214 RepID=UPI00307D97A7